MAVTRSFDEALGSLAERVEGTLEEAERTGIFPHAAPSATGAWEGTHDGMWTSGFWAGLLWHRAAMTGREGDAATATGWTLRLAPHLERKTHDIGFVFSTSAVLGWEIGRVPACRGLALRAADRLAAMFHPGVGVIPVGSEAEVAAGLDDVTIDCMVNLPLLWWAWQAGGEARFRQVAISHADRTAAWHVKGDGRIIQSVHFDPGSGRVTGEETHQGSGVAGCWARGQAWGIYGFAAAYRATGEARFLDVAARAAAYYFRRAGDELVPFYCFDDPARPRVARDTSAAAIASAGLWILAEHSPDEARRRGAREHAEAVLRALVTGSMTPQGNDDRRPRGMLLHGCYNMKAGLDTDHELIWGDYYLMESLRAWDRLR